MKASKIVLAVITALAFTGIGFAAPESLGELPKTWNKENPQDTIVKKVFAVEDTGIDSAGPNAAVWFGSDPVGYVKVTEDEAKEYSYSAVKGEKLYTQFMIQNEPLFPLPEGLSSVLRIYVRETDSVNKLIAEQSGEYCEIELTGIDPLGWFGVTVKTVPGQGHTIRVWNGSEFLDSQELTLTSLTASETPGVSVSGIGSFANLLASHGDPDRSPLYLPPPVFENGTADESATQYVFGQLLDLGAVTEEEGSVTIPLVKGNTVVSGESVALTGAAAIDAAYLLGAGLNLSEEFPDEIVFSYQLGLCHLDYETSTTGETTDRKLTGRVRLVLGDGSSAPAESHQINGMVVIQGSANGTDWDETPVWTSESKPAFVNGELDFETPDAGASGCLTKHYKFYRVIVKD